MTDELFSSAIAVCDEPGAEKLPDALVDFDLVDAATGDFDVLTGETVEDGILIPGLAFWEVIGNAFDGCDMECT